MEETRKRIRDRAAESRRKRAESRETSTATVEKSFEDDEDMSIIEDKPRSLDDDSDIEELSGLSESGELRQRKTKSAVIASS